MWRISEVVRDESESCVGGLGAAQGWVREQVETGRIGGGGGVWSQARTGCEGGTKGYTWEETTSV